MSVSHLLAELRSRKIQLTPEPDGKLHYVAPRGAMTDELRAQVAEHRHELIEALVHEPTPGAEVQQGSFSLDRFLADASIPAAIFHSRALGRDFILARDQAALEVLTDEDRGLPVFFFGEAPSLEAPAPRTPYRFRPDGFEDGRRETEPLRPLGRDEGVRPSNSGSGWSGATGSLWPISRSIALSSRCSSIVQNERAIPSAPARPVRPMRCT